MAKRLGVSPEETAGSVEMALGMWGAVGPSNHVLHGGPDPPMLSGNSSPIEKYWDCVFPSVQRHVSLNHERCTTCIRASQHACGQFPKGHGSFGRRCGLLSYYFDLLFPLQFVIYGAYKNSNNKCVCIHYITKHNCLVIIIN